MLLTAMANGFAFAIGFIGGCIAVCVGVVLVLCVIASLGSMSAAIDQKKPRD